ncbi:MAG: hypothetical protein EA403_10360 [Spirochaetaceae bacterium]|nr:MAG: hypothetical protein EA403_10360 [Spirochaetaceae bacterium]
MSSSGRSHPRPPLLMRTPLLASALVTVLLFVAISLLAPEPIPDTQFGADGERIAAILAELSDEGLLDAYRRMLLVDFFFPLAYTAFFVLALQSLFRGALGQPGWARGLSAVAVVACVLDYVENIAVLVALAGFPAHHPVLPVIGPVTTAKWIAVVATVGSLFIGAGIVTARRVRKSHH